LIFDLKNEVMKKRCIIIFVLVLSNASYSYLVAQESTNAAGGNSSGTGGSVSFSIGQVFYQTYDSPTSSITEGVQQPFEISTHSSVPQTEGIELIATAFPNPTLGYLSLNIENFDISNLSWYLFDNNGKSLTYNQISSSETSIDMTQLVPATYYLKVMKNDQEIKTFKILKF
jgi:hypothetical protein